MPLTAQVLHVLDDALQLQGRALRFDRSTALLGSLPELDSMAVWALSSGVENHCGVAFCGDDLHGAVFASVGQLCDLVEETLAQHSA